MFSPVSSTRIPDTALKNILMNLDFRSMQILRKTCCDLRNFIDDIHTNTRLIRIHATVQSTVIQLLLDFENCTRFQIEYTKHQNDCLIVKYDTDKSTSKLVGHSNFLDVFCGDFGVILRQQSQVLQELKLVFEQYNYDNHGCKSMEMMSIRIMDAFENILKFRRLPLKVKQLEIEVINHSQLARILPYISIEKLIIASVNLKARECFEIAELQELGQWTTIKELVIYQFVVPVSTEFFTHFEKVNVIVKSLPNRELLYLKNRFLRSSKMKSFKMHCKELGTSNLTDIFGHSYDDVDGNGNKRKRWFFQTPDQEEEVLLIQYDCYFCIHFCRVSFSSV